jgi:hypothetical protein
MRWVLVPLVGALVALVSVFVGMLVVVGMGSFCPAEAVDSGFCMHPLYEFAFNAVVASCSLVAGFGMVFLSAAVAPGRRREVALIALSLGVCGSLYAWIVGVRLAVLVAGGLGGATALLFARRRWGHS